MATDNLIDISAPSDTPVGIEARCLAAGVPWFTTEIAGLQFYDYGVWCPILEKRVMPQDGERVELVRAPENAHDANAVEVWFHNGVRLGHLPRAVAAVVAGPLDRGERCEGFIRDVGTGEAWTATAILVGEAVRQLHEKHIRHAIEDGLREHETRERAAESRRREMGRGNGIRFREEDDERRKRRIVQAVNALMPGLPFEIEPPIVGSWVELFRIEKLLDVSRSTARRIAERAGSRIEVHRRGCYANGTHVEVTPRLRAALLDWAAHPVRRITHEDVALSADSIVAPETGGDDSDDIPF